MILITSANGNQGKRLIPKLLAAGHRVRACVRTEESARYLREQGVQQVLLGDLADAAFIAEAVRGVALVLAKPELHSAATYELAGPDRFTGHDIGRVLSQVLGRDIRVERMDPEIFIRARMGDSDPSVLEYQLRMIRAIEARYSSHD